MGQRYDFPTRKQPMRYVPATPRTYDGDARSTPALPPAAEIARDVSLAIGGGIIQMVRYALFFVLGWVRPLVQLVCNGLAGLCLIGTLLGLAMAPDYRMPVGCAILGVSAFAIAFIYDMILMAIAPVDTVMVL